jgi:Fe2+ transport system protein FeoA
VVGKLRSLVEVPNGGAIRVVRIRGPCRFHLRLLKVGLTIGRTMRVTRREASGGYVHVTVGDQRIALTVEEAARIYVEKEVVESLVTP